MTISKSYSTPGLLSKFQRLLIIGQYLWNLCWIFSFSNFFKSLRYLPRRVSVALDFFRGSLTTTHLPTNLQFELTNICNLNCVMCPSQKQTRQRGHIDKQTYMSILDSYGKGLEIIDFSLMGETLIHPEYDWFIKEAKRRGIRVVLSTNATFLTEENSRKIIDAGVDIFIISIDDVDGGSYNEIRKGANFDKVMENTRKFLALNDRKIFTIIQMIQMSINKKSTWDYVKAMLPLGAHQVRVKPYRDLDRTMHSLRTKDLPASKMPCPYLWRAPVVTWEGTVLPCAVDFDGSHPLAKRPEKFIDAWNGPKFQEMRKLHVEGKKDEIDLCRGCSSLKTTQFELAVSSLFDGLNFRKTLPVFQTVKILLQEINQ